MTNYDENIRKIRIIEFSNYKYITGIKETIPSHITNNIFRYNLDTSNNLNINFHRVARIQNACAASRAFQISTCAFKKPLLSIQLEIIMALLLRATYESVGTALKYDKI